MSATTTHTNLEIVQIPAGPIETNAFLVIDQESAAAMIIDAPPDSVDLIESALAERDTTPLLLVVTHTHWDHIVDTDAISRRFDIPVWVHGAGRDALERPQAGNYAVPAAQVSRELEDGDVVELGRHSFSVLHTPGHIADQISLYSQADGVMFGGDTLFPNGYGRVDIPGASEESTVETIRRLLELPDAVTVYPGHGAPTTIGQERQWMQQVASTGRLLG